MFRVAGLSYTYSGNCLSGIDDAVSSSTYVYQSDRNGNEAYDGNTLLAYWGSFVYESRDTVQLESIGYSQGRIVPENGSGGRRTFNNKVYMSDQVGSTRVVLDIDNEESPVVEQNDYLPFGKRAALPGYVTDTTNRYRFNGKEEQAVIGVPYTDYGARLYDTFSARWLSQDPNAEKYYGFSPYVFCGGNPVNFFNPDGKREWPVNPTYNGYERRHENNFGAPRDHGRRTHKGVDINFKGGKDTDRGAPILATHDGRVTRIVSIKSGDTNPGGNRVQITSSDGSVSTRYMHLEAISKDIHIGTVVTEGQQIGTMGSSGSGKSNETVTHLHYEIAIDGVNVNPSTSSATLFDPQTLITPINGGTLPEAVVIAPNPVLEIPVPELKPIPAQLPDRRDTQ